MKKSWSFAVILSLGLSHSTLAQTVTLFGNAVPANVLENDPNAVTLGIKFYSTQAGTVSACRIYRAHKDSNGYTCRLYTAGGTLLGQVKFPSDSTNFHAGWETAAFASPISIPVNTTLIVAYYTSNGDYGATEFGLTNGVTSGPLVAPASGVSGGNGIYTYGGGFQFPTSTYEDSNYFVDVIFTPSAPPPPTLSLVFLPANPSIPDDAAPGATVATVTASWSDGSPFTGTYSFAAPYGNDSAVFALSATTGSSVNLIVNPTGPGVSGDANTVQTVSVSANQ